MISESPVKWISDIDEHISQCASEENLQSVFLIGSCSEGASDEWYQDYDIHFLFNQVYIPIEKLDCLLELLKNLGSRSNKTAKIEYFVKDRHWKMVPQESFPINIGIHATLLNSADHFRRLHYNPILSSNMYGRCSVLHGSHPASIRGHRPSSIFDYLHSVGGGGWLAENFSRTVALYQLDPNDHVFYPFIAGYCWNIASSLMFHIFTLSQGGLSGRRHAFEFFLSINDVQPNHDLVEAANLLYVNRENIRSDTEFARPLINATGLIINYAKKFFLTKLPEAFHKDDLAKNKLVSQELYTPVMKKLIGDDLSCRVIDIFRDENLDYYDSISMALNEARKEYGELISPKENFEFVRELLTSENKITKIRIWDSLSGFRLKYSHDFDLDRGVKSQASIFFGWEDGLQTLLQRLNEIYIEKAGKIDHELERLCEFINLLTTDRLFCEFNINNQSNENFDQLRMKLAKLLELYCFKNC